MGLKVAPACRIEVGGQDVTGGISARLLRLSVIDNSGEESDEVEIELDDRDNQIAEPRRGAALSVELGWEGRPLVRVGQFTVDESWPEGPPDRLIIRGKSADMRSGLKAARSRAWRETTVGTIVQTIAGEHGLQAAVASDLAGRAVAHRDQTNESDLHFLTRLGRDFGAVAAPKNGRLVFAPAGSGLAASGSPLTALTIDRADLTEWKGVAADREAHGRVRARYRDLAQARTLYATAGDGDPVRTLRSTYRDEATAQAAAEAELARSVRDQGGVELTLAGRPELAAQTPFTLTGLRSSLNRRWTAETVEHQLDFGGGGFTTLVKAVRAGPD